MSHIVVAGSNGFIGRALVRRLEAGGRKVVRLERKASQGAVVWDGRTQGDWGRQLEGAAAVVNLAGAPISLPWTQANRQLIIDSRIQPTRAIREAIERCSEPPKAWLNGSAIGFYGDTGDREVDEESPKGSGFLADTTARWEEEAHSARCRVVLLRTGLVMGREGGMLPLLTKLTRSFLGGAVGSGKQFMPWIHLEDELGLIEWAIESSVAGPLNLTAPEPATNSEFMSAMRKAIGRPWSPPAPSIGLKVFNLLGGPDPELALVSSRVLPRVAMRHGYPFRFAALASALQDLLK
jgi:uncharacterized protein (TIGR01777 family)